MKKRYGYIGILMALVMISGCGQAENKTENEQSMDIEGNVDTIKSPDASMVW